jgi:hypothetical protein
MIFIFDLVCRIYQLRLGLQLNVEAYKIDECYGTFRDSQYLEDISNVTEIEMFVQRHEELENTK